MSLKLENGSQPIADLFNIQGKVRNIIVISAYIDFESINQLIEFAKNRSDDRCEPSLRIFIDKAASHFVSNPLLRDQFIKASRDIYEFCNSESGIFLVQVGSLFHSKAYLIEGNKRGKVLFGSMNMTQSGIQGNEEIVIFDEINIGTRSKSNLLAKWITNYANSLSFPNKSTKVGIDTKFNYPSCLRQLLLDGLIYYEQKEQSPFRFELHLPDSIINQQVNIDKLLESSITDSISIPTLIAADKPFGLNIKLPKIGQTKAHWKKYCVETCYGYWSPDCLRDDLAATLKKRKEERQPHFEIIKLTLYDKSHDIKQCFLAFCLRIQTYLKNEGISNWRYADKAAAEKVWDNWYEKLLSKLENTKYYERIILGISSVPTPDVWNDLLSSEEFENSFCESLMYQWSKEHSKETSNVVAQAFACNLGLDPDKKEELTIAYLNRIINQWMIDNPSLNITTINDD
jgi:hypothetical protein